MGKRYKSLEDAFASNCPKDAPPDQCWEWQGTINPNGYGMVRFQRKAHSAHRLSYEIHVGPIPDGMLVLHRCDNRRCVNPHHLRIGTDADNMRDKVNKGRQARLKGPQQGQSKLKPAQVWKIRLLAKEGVTQAEIARRYGVSQPYISKIVRGEAWSYFTMP